MTRDSQPFRPAQAQDRPELPLLRMEVKGRHTYACYAAASAEAARRFLSFAEVTKPHYYVQVETPEGVWGRDKEGLYLVELLAYQTRLSLVQCEGRYTEFSSASVLLAARGVTDNFVSGIICGACGQEWQDGLRYHNKTAVQCPRCKQYNGIDTSNININVL